MICVDSVIILAQKCLHACIISSLSEASLLSILIDCEASLSILLLTQYLDQRVAQYLDRQLLTQYLDQRLCSVS